MDIGLNTLLVASMFVTILSMGIGNILMALADIFNKATASKRDGAHIGWIFLVLLVHFNMFWHTKEILAVDDWQFGGFLLAMAGPVLIFFATSILLTNPPEDDNIDLTEFFMGLGRHFFWMFALLQVWIVGVGVALTGSLVATDVVNVLFGVLAVGLAINTNNRIRLAGICSAWGICLASYVIRWIA